MEPEELFNHFDDKVKVVVQEEINEEDEEDT